ncbi:MAG: HU family DNA-binding protein [Puniceicoccales bacterium]|jgi:DNA-binding protein HU-beta|nr:HU family DNA-binding protein [Puniceicoccales bacterium]
MNKSELINETYNLLSKCGCTTTHFSEHKFTKACAEQLVTTVLDAMTNGIKKDGNVQIIGFGTFSVTKREKRNGVNPRTGEKIVINASKSVKFKPGAKLKEML